MAKVRPYGDPKAHGKLNDSLLFRRGRCFVILQTNPHPKPSNSPGQIAKRNELIQANKSYSLLTQASKHFYAKRAGQRRKNRKTMFMWAQMNNRVPSTNIPILMKSIEDMVIYNPVGDQPDTIEFSIYNVGAFPALEVWNPLDSIPDGYIPSNTGPNGTIVGSLELVDGKFDNAARQSADDSALTFPDSVMNWEQGYYGFWIKTDFDMLLGYPQSMDELVFAMTYGNSTGLMSFNFGLTPGNRIMGLRTVYQTLLLDGSPAATWNAGEWVHITYAWDRYATNGWTTAVFINGALAKSGTNPWINILPATRTFNILGPVTYSPAVWGRVVIDDLLISRDISNLFTVLQYINVPGARAIGFYASIEDNSNIFTKIQEIDTPVVQILRISTLAGYSADIPFRYLISVEWKNTEGETVNSVIRLPELQLEALQVIELYLARDWSVYWDPQLHRLACTNRV